VAGRDQSGVSRAGEYRRQLRRAVRSPSFEMKLPSVVSLKTYVKPSTHPAFTRFNVFLRDRFSCQYLRRADDLTFDHLVPRSRGGHTTWGNVVAACSPCNLRKGSMTRTSPRCGRRKDPSSRRCSTCTAMAGCSRPITCTTAGSIISTGHRARSVSGRAGEHRREPTPALHWADLYSSSLSTRP